MTERAVTLQYDRRRVQHVLLLQVMVGIILIGSAVVIAGSLGLKSACLACVAYWLPYFCSLKATFRHQGARAAQQIVRSFYQGEVLKIGLSMILFTLIFAFLKPMPWIFFSVYIGMQLFIGLISAIVK